MGIPFVSEDATPNGTASGTEETKPPAWAAILDAPDYLTLIKKDKTATAKEYETKVQSILKEGIKFGLGMPEGRGLADVAAILAYGPDFAERAGELADFDERAKKALDIITAPDNPWLMFALAALPFVAQVFRNHEGQIKARRDRPKLSKEERKAQRAARPRAEFTVFKRKFRVPFRLKLQFGFLRSGTAEPGFLVNKVFSNEDVQKMLHKHYGVTFNAKT